VESPARKTVKFNIPLTIKVDMDILRTLDIIALFEKKKRATLSRDILVEKIQVYGRNPAYKRFVKLLEGQHNDSA
jgi:hypothetical protein